MEKGGGPGVVGRLLLWARSKHQGERRRNIFFYRFFRRIDDRGLVIIGEVHRGGERPWMVNWSQDTRALHAMQMS